MAKIVGIDGMTAEQVHAEVQIGGRFVFYQFCISIVVMSFKRSSSIYFIRAGEGRFPKGLPFTAISLLLGWWGFPWGPIWTISTIVTNFNGGRDVTAEVVRSITAPKPTAAP
jgi:hypothetical protein